MMTSEQIIDATVAWVEQAIPALAGKVYEHTPSVKQFALPDCNLILTDNIVQRDGGDDFPFLRLQQFEVDVYQFGASFVVAAGTTDAEEQAAEVTLRTFGDAIKTATRSGLAIDAPEPLVPGVRPRFQYQPLFVRYEDGTRGREMTAQLSVAQLLEVVSA